MKSFTLALLATAAFAADPTTADNPFAPLEMGTSLHAGNDYQSVEFHGTYRLGLTNQAAPVQVLGTIGSGFARDDDSHAVYLLGGFHGRYENLLDVGTTLRLGRTDDGDGYVGISGDAVLWLIGSRSWSLGALGSVHTTSETSSPFLTAGLTFTVSPY